MIPFITLRQRFSSGIVAVAVITTLLDGTQNPIAAQTGATPAPGQNQVYRSDVYGISFQYPPGWVLKDQPTVHTITLSTAPDAQALQSGKPPTSLVISLAFTNFREVNANNVTDFGKNLLKLAGITTDQQAAQAQQSQRAVLHSVQVGSAAGMALDVYDPNGGIGGESIMLSIGARRIAIVRGIATADIWHNQGGQALFNAILSTIGFFPPPNALIEDQIGQVIWQNTDPRFKGFADLDAQSGGATILASDPTQGLWVLDTNGNVTAQNTFPGIGAYGSLLIFTDGTRYVSDPVNHAIWVIPAGGTAKKLVSGTQGNGRGQFAPDSPHSFTLGYQLTFYVLDTNDKGTHIIVFDRGGGLVSDFPLGATVQNGVISSDALGRLYVVGSNLDGVWQISGNGQTVAQDIGKGVLTGSAPTAVTGDRFGNIYVATTDEGIVKLDSNGTFRGVIGQPYDDSTPPKPGQLAHPTALTLSNDALTLYVGDSGKHPQIVAFSLQNAPALDLATGTQDMGVIGYGQPVNGTLTGVKFANTYTFAGQKGDVVTITMKATPAAAGSVNTLDPYVELLGQGGSVLAANDDSSGTAGLGTKDAEIATFTLPVDGSYTIRATRFGRETGSSVGAYSLTLSK